MPFQKKVTAALQTTNAEAGFSDNGNESDMDVILGDKPKPITIPEKVIVKPYVSKDFRLGLERTKENFVRVPGTIYRWAPTKVGDIYKTGLEYISDKKKIQLERALGKKLDNYFYADITYVMDGSNPNGHHMDLTDPFELVIYLAFIDSDLVATSKQQIATGKKPFAEWYIENDEVEAEEQEKERDDTISIIETYQQLSNPKRAAYCKLLGINVYGVSPKVASAKLWEALQEKGKKGIINKKKFLQVSEWSDEKIAVSEEVEDAIVNNILRRNSAQDWLYGQEIIGSSKEQVVSKLMSSENSSLRIAIKNALERYN